MFTAVEEENKMRFREVLEEFNCPESLAWCRKMVEERMTQVCAERARSIRDGEIVEVTEGALAGRCGRVVGHCCHARSSLLVELDDIDVGVPVPIPSWALKPLSY